MGRLISVSPHSFSLTTPQTSQWNLPLPRLPGSSAETVLSSRQAGYLQFPIAEFYALMMQATPRLGQMRATLAPVMPHCEWNSVLRRRQFLLASWAQEEHTFGAWTTGLFPASLESSYCRNLKFHSHCQFCQCLMNRFLHHYCCCMDLKQLQVKIFFFFLL